MEKISYITTHWGMNDFRSELLRKSLESAINTTIHLPIEFIVVDNGSNIEDSKYLLDLCHANKIQFYLRNSSNLYFGWGRNIGLDIACGDILVFSDNDIEYSPGWLDKSIEILNEYSDRKIAITPLRTDRIHRSNRYWNEWFTLNHGKEKYPANMRAGSNSWVMRRDDFNEVGRFRNHRVAGSKWTDSFVKKGFTMITMETDPLAKDLGFKRGYDTAMNVDIKRKFANGEEIIINN